MAYAARIGDGHVCLAGSGLIVGPALHTVLIEGRVAAVVGDACSCVVPTVITQGSRSVLIGGRPAARIADSTSDGGFVASGCTTVEIGG
jgi:uncharacterized Zn-binding protein involved in type VI secretion